MKVTREAFQEGVEKVRAEATTGVLSLQQPEQVVNAPFRKQEECMQEGTLHLSERWGPGGT